MERTRKPRNRTRLSKRTLELERLRTVKGRLATVNLVPGERVVDEELYPGKHELREWKPHTSKLAAAITKGLEIDPLGERPNILYLGAASGTTVSYLSDLFPKGRIYAVEFSRDPMIDLMLLSKRRTNIIPILGDARDPESYAAYLPPIDLVFQDVAQRDQIAILIKNTLLARANAQALIAVKTRSIDVSAPVKKIIAKARTELAESMTIEQEIDLTPYERDHVFFKARRKR